MRGLGQRVKGRAQGIIINQQSTTHELQLEMQKLR